MFSSGAIAVWDGGEYGHVAYVTDVQVKTPSRYWKQLQTSKADCELPLASLIHIILGNVTYIYQTKDDKRFKFLSLFLLKKFSNVNLHLNG